jgi:hypothetical protein
MVTTFGLLNRVLEKMHLIKVGLAEWWCGAYT